MKGMSEWVRLRDMQLANLLNLTRQTMPHQTTYERVLAELDETEVEQKLGHFFAQQQNDNITVMEKCKRITMILRPHRTENLCQT